MKSNGKPRSAAKTSSGMRLQEFADVFRRGGCRQREAKSVGKGVKLTGLDQLDHPLLLALAMGLGAIHGVGYLEIRQRLSSSTQTRLVGHHLLVHPGREALRAVGGPVANAAPVGIHKLARGLPPGRRPGFSLHLLASNSIHDMCYR